MTPHDQLVQFADSLGHPDVTVSALFGKPALKDSNGKAFACLHNEELACRLGRTTPKHSEALALAGAHLFDPSGNHRPMKDWVSIPVEHSARWAEFAHAALAARR